MRTTSLANWYERAGVRQDPRRVLDLDREQGRYFFPPVLVPACSHPEVTALGEHRVKELLVRRLYDYLEFTTHFEVRVVNPVAQTIADGRSGLDLPTESRLDAFRIYCDEAYHALCSADMVHQVQLATGVPRSPSDFESFLGRLNAVIDTVPSSLRSAARLLLVTVFETLITGILVQVPRDPDVVTSVRQIVADHAEDEGRHHAYFAGLFTHLWGALGREERRVLGPLLPRFVTTSIAPDFIAARAALEAIGLPSGVARDVVRDCFPRDKVVTEMRSTASRSLVLFAQHGVYDDPSTRAAFVDSNLLPG